MTNFLKNGFDFIRRNLSILYSLFLIIIIPLALYYNVSFVVGSFQKNADYILQTKLLLAESVFEVCVRDFLADTDGLQEKILEISRDNSEIAVFQILIPSGGENFKIVNSKNAEEIGKEIPATNEFTLSWHTNQNFADLSGEKGQRFWNMTKVILGSAGEKRALVRMSMSLKDVDALIYRTFVYSFAILIVTIFFVLVLLIHHTRLFKYLVLYQKLQETDKMKDEFIRMAIHELQSPIVNIKGYAETLREEVADKLTESQKESFSRISISAKNLSDLIYDLLEVSRIERGMLDFNPQKILPAAIIKDVLEEIRNKAERKKLRLIFKHEDNPYLIMANPHRFKQAIANLLENAIKYTPRGEVEIGIAINEAKKQYVISIKDTGLGISAEAQQRLFEKFYRVKTRETADISGTGLGLWMVKELSEKMGGKVFMESMEKVGTKFTLIFPLSS